ncbi:MAG: DUF192 domain-containing protein [Elusimicrobiaceae bacterium]|nr:DUF192 domain-containing protein [Elusimicrobiaceae bacterium]
MKRFFLFFAMGFLLAACTQETTVSITLPDGFKVSAALADTPEKHARGLMFVKHLPENEGMLFVFDNEEPLSFWMKNTLIDLDMVFIGADKRVTSVAAEVPHSYTYTPDSEVAFADGYGKYVLEIPSKSAAQHGLKPGTLLEFSVPEEK